MIAEKAADMIKADAAALKAAPPPFEPARS